MSLAADRDRLAVWHAQRRVGELYRDDQDRMGFAYDPEWIEHGFRIGYALPLRPEPFEPEHTIAHAWFANLLPEAAARERIVRSLGIADDDFTLLREIGGDCAGALSVLPPDQKNPTGGAAQLLDDAALAEMLRQRGQGALPFADRRNGVRPRLSLAGAQAKCPVLIQEQKMFLPTGATASSHILKFELPQWRNVPVYEIHLARLAAAVELPVPGARMETRAAHRFLVIDRYDRVLINGAWQRLHQEDFCQVAGLRPSRKYEADGGPTLIDVADGIREISDRPAEDLLNLVRWQAFNVLSGNSDGHAKNISFYQPDQHETRWHENRWRLAPFYDLVCTRAWPDLDRQLAMSIGGERDPGRIKKSHWELAANELHMRPQFIVNEVRRLIESLQVALPKVRVALEQDYGPLPMLQQPEKVIRTQLRLTGRSLS